MAGGREIKNRIKSTRNMGKVTRALEMVSASRIRRAQAMMSASRPYARHMRKVIAHIAQARTEFNHPFLVLREPVTRVGFIVVATDRGLCGGLNATLFRHLLLHIHQWHDKGVQVQVAAIGQKAVQFFRRLKGIDLVGSVTHLGEKPAIDALVGVIKVMVDAYQSRETDRVFLAFNHFVSTMTQKAMLNALLPLPLVVSELEDEAGQGFPPAHGKPESGHGWDYLYEPGAQRVLEHVLERYVESVVYQSVLENLACEHAARMVAMKNASDNANKVIDTLTLVYNKTRQAAITQEISEIVAGAAAV